MSTVEEIKLNLSKALKDLGIDTDINSIIVNTTNDPTHGDYASNAAMKNCKLLGCAPAQAAEKIISKLDMNMFKKVEIAGPGFINFYMKDDALQNIVNVIISKGDQYGRADKLNKSVNVEFVSANPTGDLHVGHARGAAIGDSICRLLDFAGYDVHREYYINDAGNQIYNLALSLEARYKEALGLPFTLPEDGYHGVDVQIIAQEILKEYGPDILSKDDSISFFKKVGIEKELDKINKDLATFGVSFNTYSSELVIRSNNAVEKELETLKPYLYVEDGATLLRTTDFLDDKDRVVVKSNGDYTYFLPDIVYHLNKLSRGYDHLVDLLGADHHGYINRMKSALMMHGYDKDVLDIELIQMVRFIKDGVEFKASKRTGNAYTLRELIEDVGVDAARYFFVMRAASTHLDFDLDLAVEQSSNNPVYYSQYAHARLCSVLSLGSDLPIDTSAKLLVLEKEKNLLKQLADFPKLVETAAKELAPYRITNYVHDLSESMHSWYNDCKIVDRNNIELSSSRLALCKAIEQVIKNALNLVGVSAPEHM